MEGRAEKLLKDFGKRIDKFVSELDDATDNLQDEFKKRYDELLKSKDNLQGEFNSFKENNKDKWEEVETNLENAGQELKNAFKTAFSSKKADDSEK